MPRPPDLDRQRIIRYLTRSGTSAPLVIDIEMRTDYLDDLDELSGFDGYPSMRQVGCAKGALEFLVAHGATTDRWSALIFCAKVPKTLFEVVHFLDVKSAPELRFLSLRWKTRMDSDAEVQERECLSLPETSIQQSSGFGSRLPRLRNLNLNALPVGYQVNRVLPLVSGLAHLNLTASFNLHPLPKVHTLLSSNLQLQSLALSAEFCDQDSFEPTALRVLLPALRSFSLDFGGCSQWAFAIIQMIDAPALEYLKLTADFNSETIAGLVERITTGASENRFAEVLRSLNDGQPVAYESIYPALRDLNIESTYDPPDELKTILSVFHTTTHVSLPDETLRLLGDAPWVLPKLECITTEMPSMLGDILRRRAEAGFPIRRVEVVEGLLPREKAKWPESVEVVERQAPSPAFDSDDNGEDFDDDYYNDYDEYEDLYEYDIEYNDLGDSGDSDAYWSDG